MHYLRHHRALVSMDRSGETFEKQRLRARGTESVKLPILVQQAPLVGDNVKVVARQPGLCTCVHIS